MTNLNKLIKLANKFENDLIDTKSSRRRSMFRDNDSSDLKHLFDLADEISNAAVLPNTDEVRAGFRAFAENYLKLAEAVRESNIDPSIKAKIFELAANGQRTAELLSDKAADWEQKIKDMLDTERYIIASALRGE